MFAHIKLHNEKINRWWYIYIYWFSLYHRKHIIILLSNIHVNIKKYFFTPCTTKETFRLQVYSRNIYSIQLSYCYIYIYIYKSLGEKSNVLWIRAYTNYIIIMVSFCFFKFLFTFRTENRITAFFSYERHSLLLWYLLYNCIYASLFNEINSNVQILFSFYYYIILLLIDYSFINYIFIIE